MKHGCAALILAVVAVAAPAAFADGMAGNTQFFMGQRFLDDDLWKPLDKPDSFGIEVDFAPERSPVKVALALHLAGDKTDVTTPFFGETGDVEAGFLEFSAGFLWHPVRTAIVRPYLGAGILKMYTTTGSEWGFFGNSENDDSFGFYGNLGVFFKVGDRFNIGVDGRIVRGTKLTLAGFDVDADYEQASVLVGFSWGDSRGD